MSDHRDLNHDLHIFTTDPLAGSGLPLWLPNGAIIREELTRLAKQIAHDDGCQDVYTPVMGKRALYERSGHWSKFADDMFPVMVMGESDELVLRPANCPHHALVYAAEQHSYRDLPIRYNETASMFRAERSGVVSGLTRVRQITLDDTHVFARADQVPSEVERALRSALRAQAILGLPVDYIRLSLRGEAGTWLGEASSWDASEAALREVAKRVGSEADLEVREAPGEAAFYGPKLDLQVTNGRGHDETIATVQLDFNQPERFGLTYRGEDGGDHRPVMIHRGTVGSMERVTAALLEHYDGRLPLWLAPTQVTVLPVAERHDHAARIVVDEARAAGLRVEIAHDGSLGSRIRAARTKRSSLIVIIGDDEVSSGKVTVRDGLTGESRSMSPSRFIPKVVRAYEQRQDFAGSNG